MSAVLMFRCSRQARIRLQSLPVFSLATADGTTFFCAACDSCATAGRQASRTVLRALAFLRASARGGRGAGFGGEDDPTIDLTVQITADPGQGFAIVEHAFAIQVVVAGNALEFGNGFRGRGMSHHAVEDTVGRAHEHVGKSPGKRNDDLHGCNGSLPLYPSARAMEFGVSPASRTFVHGSPDSLKTSSQIFTREPAVQRRRARKITDWTPGLP